MSDREIHRKYVVTRTDGSSGPGGKHEDCAYFVLDLECDAFAIPALKAYAKAKSNPRSPPTSITSSRAPSPRAGAARRRARTRSLNPGKASRKLRIA